MGGLRVGRAAFLKGSAALLLAAVAGCQPAPNALCCEFYVDLTVSEIYNHPQMLKLGDQIAGGVLSPHTYLCASKFDSTVPVNPFYKGDLRRPRSFHVALETALKEPTTGKGTNGAPLLQHLKKQADAARANRQNIIGIILTSGGFDDLPSMRVAARSLKGHPALAMVLVLPVLSTGNTAALLEATLQPLGNIARIATQLDAAQALEELRRVTQNCYGKQPVPTERSR